MGETSIKQRAPTAVGRWTLGRKLGVVFLVLALMLAAIGAIVTYQVASILLNSQQVVEEQRESSYTRELLRIARSIRNHVALHDVVGLDGDPERTRIVEELLRDAHASLAILARGPGGQDPSQADHAEAEARLFDTVAALLDRLDAAVGATTGEAEVDAVAAELVRVAEAVHEEMRDEATRSLDALHAHGERMRREVAGLVCAAFVVLVGLSWIVRRAIVRPLRALRDGAARVGAGELEHRIRIGGDDEIGALAAEFNHMAGELGSMRAGLEDEVARRTEEFVRAARLATVGTLAAGVAHEINTPLASIASCAEGLERRIRDGTSTRDEQAEYLRIIATEAHRAHEITSRLLEFGRQAPGEKVDFRLDELMHEVEVLLRAQFAGRTLALDFRCDAELPHVNGNPSECKQVVLNLIQNAIDASPPGRPIRVECRGRDGWVTLEVEDRGPGIPPESLERIFDPFFTTKEVGKGTGLGLAIVERVIEDHGGTIEVENTGHGALFRVRVPAARPRTT
ncbi:MAG: HAMP domain-containing protein [Planctomycetes bacterium]|nr:HAMP domain-containing protein [Planctomycetota bacterium]